MCIIFYVGEPCCNIVRKYGGKVKIELRKPSIQKKVNCKELKD